MPVPLFSSYTFLRHAIDKVSYINVVKTRGVAGILGERWDRLTPLSDDEIDAISRTVAAGLPALPHPYLRVGQHVRVTSGPMAGVGGILIHTRPSKGLLVISVELLRRSVAVEIDCTLVTPVMSRGPAPASAEHLAR